MKSNAPVRYIDDNIDWLVDALELARDEQSIRTILLQFTKITGFDRFAYAHLKGSNSRLFSNYPEGWLKRYLSESYFSSDPVVTDARRGMRPFNWSGDDMKRLGGTTKRLADEAADFGIRSGFSIPIRAGFGAAAMLTLASEQHRAEAVAIRDVAYGATATAFVHISLLRLASPVAHKAESPLSPRETTCLAWASLGKTKAETGVMTGLSDKTVRFYLDRVMVKLDAANIPHAVRIAFERGLI